MGIDAALEQDLREGFFATSAPDRGLYGRRRVAFTVVGVAQPQGSTRAFIPKGWTRPVITSDNPNIREWRRLVADAAQRAISEIPEFLLFTSAVAIDITFELPRPKSLPKKVAACIKKPDASKLLRCTEDALTGVLWKDDAQLVEIRVRKRYAASDQPARAEIWVEG